MATDALAATEDPDLAAFSGVWPALLGAVEANDRARFGARFVALLTLSNIVRGRLWAREPPDLWVPIGRMASALAGVEAPDRAEFLVATALPELGDEPMTAIIEGLFLPENIERDAKGGPQFNTSVFTGTDGAEFRSINWPRSYGKWSISLGYRQDDDPDYQAVLNLFYSVRGRGYGFLFKDWSDYRMVNAPLAPPATPGGPMQMQKIYAGGAASYARKITRPRDGTIVIKDWTGAILSGAAADPATGLVTGAAVGATCSCEFFVPVRFDTDILQIDVEVDGLVNCPSLDLLEVQE